jgi:hypothetical protein
MMKNLIWNISNKIPTCLSIFVANHQIDSKILSYFVIQYEVVVVLGNKHHARCAYCGATEGEQWVTGGDRYNPKIYCSPACRDAAGVWFWLCFLIFTSVFFIFIWTTSQNPIPIEFNLAMLFFIGLPLVFTVRGIQARLRVSRPSRFARQYSY